MRPRRTDTTAAPGRGDNAPMHETDVGTIAVADNPAEARYEARLGDRIVGIAEYELDDERIVFVHTQVDESAEGKGIGSALARGALDDAQARGIAVTVECPFISAWIRRHREYAGLLSR